MRDIGSTLAQIMYDKQCTSIRAFYLLTEEGGNDGLYKLQSESGKKISRRLRDKSGVKKFR